jgi:F420H(2)-dependent quinone reductase
MRIVIRLIVTALLGAVVFLGAILAASELGGEVVVLHTYREDGMAQATSLWIVDDHKQLWLRAGQPGSTWLERLRRQPQVELERGGRVGDYEAVLMPGQRDRINRLMREKYGWADWLIGLGRDASRTLPVRLDPVTP